MLRSKIYLVFIATLAFNTIFPMQPSSSEQALTNAMTHMSIGQSTQGDSYASSSSSNITISKSEFLRLLTEAIKKTPSEALSSKNSSENIAAAIAPNFSLEPKREPAPRRENFEKTSYKDAGTQTDPLASDKRFARTFSTFPGKTQEILLGLIKNEQKSIDMSAYTFNLYKVAYALCNQQNKGVSIRLILNSGCPKTIALLLMERCKIPMRFCTGRHGTIMHQKTVRFDANTGKEFLLNSNKDNDRKILDSIDGEIPYFWDGSFNFTGEAEYNNTESTSVHSDETTYPAIKNEFKSWWNSIHENAGKLATLDTTELKSTTDLQINGVPSPNTLYLLQSAFHIDNQWRYLSPAEILSYQDFAPLDLPERNAMPRIIPAEATLPFACHLVKKNNQFFIQKRADNWIRIEDITNEHIVTKYKIRLNGIGGKVDANPEQWFFKDSQGDYRTLLSLQGENSRQDEYSGPYERIGESYQFINKPRGAKKKPDQKKSYTLNQLKTTQARENSPEDLLKEYKP